VRSWRVTSDGQRYLAWLVGERAPLGQPEARKYFWSHLPTETTLAELAGYANRRHAIEPFHEEAQGGAELGPVLGSRVAGLSSACCDRNAGVQLFGLAGSALSYEAGSPTRPFFLLASRAP
jgi:hypothetical protein